VWSLRIGVEESSLVNGPEVVEPGEIIDRSSPDVMRRDFEAHDAGVIGVVAASDSDSSMAAESGYDT